MVVCSLCGEEFSNNLGGQLTNHLFSVHNITYEEYVIIVNYNGVAPICRCGYCEDNVQFYRGEYRPRGYAFGHESFKWREEQYIKLYGYPKCKSCGCLVGFRRAEPKKLCQQCSKKFVVDIDGNVSSKKYFFRDVPNAQEKVKESLMNTYGVVYVSQIPGVTEKQQQTKRDNGYVRPKASKETKAKMSKASKEMWAKPGHKEKMSILIKEATNKPEERERRSQRQKERIKEDPTKYHDAFLKSSYMSKLHIKIRDYLNLSTFGFKPEQNIGTYFVDELNEKYKIIIEINGDYVHANPKIYDRDYEIALPQQHYYAYEKWEIDRKRKEELESLGYTVWVIWESDMKEGKLEEIFVEILNSILI